MITVIVPYFNEAKTIEYTLNQLLSQSLRPECVILIDSSSFDGSKNIVDFWIKNKQDLTDINFKNISEDTSNPASSKNLGVKYSKSEWIAFMDCGQIFERDWLKKQYEFCLDHNLDYVSGTISTGGINWMDRCAVAQTYGYKKDSLTIPGTLIRKEKFLKIGFFLEGRRAGYDVEWRSRAKSLGYIIGVNKSTRIEYLGTAYASNLKNLIFKSYLYHKYTVGLNGVKLIYLYGLIIPTYLISLSSLRLFLIVLCLHLIFRGIVTPLLKARNMMLEHPIELILFGAIIGILIDLARSVGVIYGTFLYFVIKRRLIFKHKKSI